MYRCVRASSEIVDCSCPGVLLNKPELDMRFVHHATEVDYEFHMREVLPSKLLTDCGMVYLSIRCLPRPFSSFVLIREVDS